MSADDLLLIVAMAYASSIYIEAWNPSAKLSAPSHTWRRVGDALLSAQGYPHRTCLESIRPAILLAQQGVSEKPVHPDPSKITILARVTQMAGLQQDPALLKLPPDQCSDRRKLYWLVRELDLGFSVAHGLPCLLKSSDSSVEPLHHEETVAAFFLNFRVRATNVFEKILEKVYGPRRCLVSTVVDLQAEVQQLESEANTLITKHRTESGAAGRFVAYAVEMIVARLCYTLNQPYLRDPSWGQRCRNLTLQGATKFLEKYQRRRKDFVCAPFTWVFEQFNVYHPCAILLQDLIKNVETIDIENDCRAQTVLQVFREFYDEKDSHWIKLEQLRLKAWYVNSWILPPHQNGSALEVDIDLVDWDNLFSSFIAEDVSMFQNTAIPDSS
ncbi:hypothetical protein B9Z65_7216 [Elsinoe australis]|uniref:Transcription factor domain-containing protein n=1 Tax=Elsinoe australis TaxID=40998 RepID=A0A2P7Z645_9PEZI|nr:hypothetical protein B9Z65_7216 [Elsinoe australis]